MMLFYDNSNNTEIKACSLVWLCWGISVPKNVLACKSCSIQVCEPSVMFDWLCLSGQSHWTGALSASL